MSQLFSLGNQLLICHLLLSSPAPSDMPAKLDIFVSQIKKKEMKVKLQQQLLRRYFKSDLMIKLKKKKVHEHQILRKKFALKLIYLLVMYDAHVQEMLFQASFFSFFFNHCHHNLAGSPAFSLKTNTILSLFFFS